MLASIFHHGDTEKKEVAQRIKSFFFARAKKKNPAAKCVKKLMIYHAYIKFSSKWFEE